VIIILYTNMFVTCLLLEHWVCHMSLQYQWVVHARGGGVCLSGGCPPVTVHVKQMCHFAHYLLYPS
jgi:hypothetical protein